MQLENLIDEFNSQTGIEKAAPVEGVWRYSADGHAFGITADGQGERLYLFGDIPTPGDGREEAFRKASLEANYFFHGTAGATLAINPDAGTYALVQSATLAGMTPEGFFTLVETFVNTLATWSAIADGTREAPSADGMKDATLGEKSGAREQTVSAVGRLGFLQV